MGPENQKSSRKDWFSRLAGCLLAFSLLLFPNAVGSAMDAVPIFHAGSRPAYFTSPNSSKPETMPIPMELRPFLIGQKPPEGIDLPSVRGAASSLQTETGINLLAATVFGGSAWDAVYAVAIDSAGAVYLAGETASKDFVLNGSVGNSDIQQSDVFLMKLSPDLSQIEYAVALGGGSIESVYGMVVENGIVYLTGETWSRDFPAGVFPGGENDVWVAAVAADGSGLIYAVRFGGIDQDRPGSIAVLNGNAVVAGVTWSADFPGGGYKGEGDAFVVKLNPDGSLNRSALIGGANTDAGFDIDTRDGRILVCGQTWSRFFPVAGLKGLDDGFVLQLDENLSLLGGTLLGGTAEDSISTCAYSADGSALAGGETLSADFPFTDPGSAAGQNGFAARFTPDLTLAETVLVGGDWQDRVLGLAVSADSKVWLTGSSNSGDFPTAGEGFQTGTRGETDVFAVLMDASDLTAGPKFSTLIGGTGHDYGQAVATMENGLVLIGGYSLSDDFPTAGDADWAESKGSQDAFIIQLGAGTDQANLPTATPQPPIATATPAPTLSEDQIGAVETAIPATAMAATDQAETTPIDPSPELSPNPPTVTASAEAGASSQTTLAAKTDISETAAASQSTPAPVGKDSQENRLVYWGIGVLGLMAAGGIAWAVISRRKGSGQDGGK